MDNTPKTARIWKKQLVEKDSHVLGDGDPSSILSGDFSLPGSEQEEFDHLIVKLVSLDLFASEDSEFSTPAGDQPTPSTDVTQRQDIKNYSAMMRFTINSKGHESRETNIALTYDVHFVTAHPCVPTRNNSILQTQISPTFHATPRGATNNQSLSGPHDLFIGKPTYMHCSILSIC